MNFQALNRSPEASEVRIDHFISVYGEYLKACVHDVGQALPPGSYDNGGPSNFPDEQSRNHVLKWVLTLRGHNRVVNPRAITSKEATELWNSLLTKEQRQEIMRKLKHVSVYDEVAGITNAVKNTELETAIQAWASLREAAKLADPEYPWEFLKTVWEISRQAMRAILTLETKLTLAQSAPAPGLIADLSPKINYKLLPMSAGFDKHLEWFAHRARCHKAIPETHFLTMIDALGMMRPYVIDLKATLEVFEQ